MNTAMHLFSTEIVWRLGWTLLHFVWEGAAIALTAGILLAVLRRRSASARYMVGCATTMLMLVSASATLYMIPGPPTVEALPSETNFDAVSNVAVLPDQRRHDLATKTLLTEQWHTVEEN